WFSASCIQEIPWCHSPHHLDQREIIQLGTHGLERTEQGARMTRLVPPGFLTFREVVSKLENAMFAGVLDSEEVKKYREHGYSVGDGASSRNAADEHWNAV